MSTGLILVLTVGLSVLAFTPNRDSVKLVAERDQELFLAGANAISREQYDEGRILLNTMINTYSDSPLVEQARILIFFSYAREGGPRNEKSRMLLQEIEQHMGLYQQKSRFH